MRTFPHWMKPSALMKLSRYLSFVFFTLPPEDPQASALSEAQGSAISALFLDSNCFTPDCFLKAAYASILSHAAANPAIQQMYFNGQFCFAFKSGMITNGLGSVGDNCFYTRNFLAAHPDIVAGKISDSPDEFKSLAASMAWNTPICFVLMP